MFAPSDLLGETPYAVCARGRGLDRYDVGLQKSIKERADPRGNDEFLEQKPKCRGFKSSRPHQIPALKELSFLAVTRVVIVVLDSHPRWVYLQRCLWNSRKLMLYKFQSRLRPCISFSKINLARALCSLRGNLNSVESGDAVGGCRLLVVPGEQYRERVLSSCFGSISRHPEQPEQQPEQHPEQPEQQLERQPEQQPE